MEGLPVARFAPSGRHIARDHTQPRAGHGPGGRQRASWFYPNRIVGVFGTLVGDIRNSRRRSFAAPRRRPGLQLVQRGRVSIETLGRRVAENAVVGISASSAPRWPTQTLFSSPSPSHKRQLFLCPPDVQLRYVPQSLMPVPQNIGCVSSLGPF